MEEREFAMSQSEKPKPQIAGQEYPLLQMLKGIPVEMVLTQFMMGMRRNIVTAWDRKGTILLCNQHMARGYRKASPLEVIGANVKDFAPEEWAEERIGFVNRALDSGEALTALEIQGGQRLNCRYLPLKSLFEGSTTEAALIVVEKMNVADYRELMNSSEKDRVIYAEHISLGKLDVLSSRELEVLALMGQGFRAKDIAKILFRSVSTIENHRENIGRKLNTKDRSKLVALARLAVLLVGDASRKRAEFAAERAYRGEEEYKTLRGYDGKPGNLQTPAMKSGKPELDYQPGVFPEF